MKQPKPDVEYRIVCASYHDSRKRDANHRAHVYTKATWEKAVKACAWNNEDPVFVEHPTPDKIGCLPWCIEARVVTPWEFPDDAEALASMLIADWYDDPSIPPQPAPRLFSDPTESILSP